MERTTVQKKRISKHLSQSELARLSGVNLRTLQDFEQGRKPLKNAKGEMLYRLSLALSCSIEELLGDSTLVLDINKSTDHSYDHIASYYNQLVSKTLYDKYYTFPVVVPECKVDMRRIYPTKQALIYTLHNKLSDDKRIASIMLFGSSITMQCNKDSDTDLAIRLDEHFINNDVKNNVSETVQEIFDWNADIIWYDRLEKNERIYHDICKGVQVV